MLAEGMSENIKFGSQGMKYPQKSLVASIKTSAQIEHIRCLLICVGLVNFLSSFFGMLRNFF